jgi:hypothetical protein
MILITLSQVLCTRFLQPPCKGDNGRLVVVVIALLVIAWFIILRNHPYGKNHKLCGQDCEARTQS